ncbi:MAG: selenocysteine-specific translation elongation factor, partial [Jatrophihabitans sp.]|nr:selenocysteine-specific translation elongation factor [Jatrophihabitans sp.]
LEARLAEEPFRAPERAELAELGLGHRELAAAQRASRVLRINDDVVLLPSAPASAAEILRSLTQPFTISQARQALDTSRRVAVPLLEHLDRLGLTERVDEQRRRLRGAPNPVPASRNSGTTRQQAGSTGASGDVAEE